MTMDGKGTRTVQLIDLTDTRSNPDGSLTRNHKEVPRGEVCYFASPFDFPGYVRFWRRLVDKTKGKQIAVDHIGTTMEIDMYTFGMKVYLRFDRGRRKGDRGKLNIILEDGDGMSTVATYQFPEGT